MKGMKINDISISVVVSTFNRVAYLKQCVDRLLELNFDNFEIIIVNDGSTDSTRDYLNNLKNNRIRIVHHRENLGLSSARNSGIKAAKYDIIAFTDDDCLADKNWLRNIAEGFTDDSIGFVIGQVFYVKKDYIGYFPERLVRNIGAKWPMGCNIAYQKKVFDDVGDFEDRFFKYGNEDSEMAIRTIVGGYSYARSPNAIVIHQAMDWDAKSLLKSAKNASVWPILKKKYPDHYLVFGPPVKYGVFVEIRDYLYILTLPVLIPLLLARYLLNKKSDLGIFFIKWPIYLFMRRYYIYREAVKNKVLMA